MGKFDTEKSEARPKSTRYREGGKPVDYIGYPDYSFTETIIHPIVHQLDKQLRKVYESPFTGSIRAMLLENVGITWLPLSVVADDLRTGRLLCLEGENLSTELRIMVYRRRESTGPVMEEFWRHISEAALRSGDASNRDDEQVVAD